jgi:hypothetical protein
MRLRNNEDKAIDSKLIGGLHKTNDSRIGPIQQKFMDRRTVDKILKASRFVIRLAECGA